MKEFVGLKATTYTNLKDNNDEDKKTKDAKKCAIERKLGDYEIGDYENCIETAQIEIKINHLEKIKMDADSPKEFIKNDKLIFKTWQIFKVKVKIFLRKKLTRLL